MRRWHWFQFIAHGILALFMGIMLYVVYIAFNRHSGSTGLDMASIQKMRYEAIPGPSPIPPSPSSSNDL